MDQDFRASTVSLIVGSANGLFLLPIFVLRSRKNKAAFAGIVSLIALMRPNRLYGLRVSATFANDWIWYEANARSGDRLGLSEAMDPK